MSTGRWHQSADHAFQYFPVTVKKRSHQNISLQPQSRLILPEKQSMTVIHGNFFVVCNSIGYLRVFFPQKSFPEKLNKMLFLKKHTLVLSRLHHLSELMPAVALLLEPGCTTSIATYHVKNKRTMINIFLWL